MNIACHVERGHTHFADRPAILFEGRTITYANLDEAANRFANGLHTLGVESGDRFAILLPNQPEWVIAYLGVQKIGAIAVSINPSLKPDEVAFLLADSGARGVVTSSTHRHAVRTHHLPRLAHFILAEVGVGLVPTRPRDTDASGQRRPGGDKPHPYLGQVGEDIAFTELLEAASPDRQAVDMAADDPAAIVYTSGTTGFPKGAVLSHRNVLTNIAAKKRYLGIEPQDRLLLFLPLFHCFGQNAILNAGLESGATLVLQRHFDQADALRAIADDGVTMFFGVPTTYQILIEQASVESMGNVRYFFSAAAGLPGEIENRWSAKFGRVIHQGYGLTETSPFASYNHLTHHKAGSIGTPIENVEMKVISVEDGSELADSEAGEIVIRGPNVMLGYWNRIAETEEAIRDGWFRTGDIGHRDRDGYFFLDDRLKDMVNVGGLKAFPAEIENVILQSPDVAEVAVYGVKNALFGERVMACVVPRAGSRQDGRGLIEFCRERLADYKVPDRVEFVDSIPRSPTGKVLKRVLRERHETSTPLTANPGDGNGHFVSPSCTMDEARNWALDWVAQRLNIARGEIAADRSFFDFGLTSSDAMQLASDAGERFGTEVSATIAWRYPTIDALAAHLAGVETSAAPVESGTDLTTADDLAGSTMSEIAELLSQEIAAAKERKSR